MTGPETPPLTTAKVPAAAAQEIQQLARTYQYDRYLAALLLPRRHREALVVLAAFAGELQRIPQITTEPMMAAIRLQWWRDELSRVTGASASRDSSTITGTTGHFLLDAIANVVRTYRLPHGLLLGMIDAVECELDPAPFQEDAEMRQILLKFEGAQFELAGSVLRTGGPHRALWPRALLSSAAVAYGAARLAAELPSRNAAGAQTYVSREAAAKLQDGDVAGISQALANMARTGLAEARPYLAALAGSERGAFLPLATVQPLLGAVAMQLQQNDAKEASTEASLSDLARAWAVLLAHWRGRV